MIDARGSTACIQGLFAPVDGDPAYCRCPSAKNLGNLTLQIFDLLEVLAL